MNNVRELPIATAKTDDAPPGPPGLPTSCRILLVVTLTLLGLEIGMWRRCVFLIDRAILVAIVGAQCMLLATFLMTPGSARCKTVAYVAHLAFAASIIAIPLVARDPALIALHAFAVIVTMATRRKMGHCILRDVDRGTNYIPNPFDWDVIFPAAGIVSVARLYWGARARTSDGK